MQVAAAIGGMLVGREAITLGEIEDDMPAHILAGRPSHKSMVSALAAAGWLAERQSGGRVVYRAPRDPGESATEGDNRAVENEELQMLIERVLRLRAERREIVQEERDVIREAKSRGYDPIALRRAITIAGKDQQDWHAGEAILETYLRAVGMVAA